MTKARRPGARVAAGFTLIEMMVTVVLFSILTLLAVPAMTDWVRNTRIRAAADVLQNGLRLAQSEALRRSRQTIFTFTDAVGSGGQSYAVNTVLRTSSDDSTTNTAAYLVETGALVSPNSGVQITTSTPRPICFNSLGRLVANPSNTPIAGGCPAPTSPTRFDITLIAGGGRPMRVLVSLGGQVRMCDPAKPLATYPDGCPPP